MERSDEESSESNDDETTEEVEKETKTGGYSAANTVQIKEKQLEDLPDEVLGHIFQFLDFLSRGKVAQLCHRFNTLLTCGSYGMKDVVVVNLFEKEVWVNNVNQSSGSKIRCRPLADIQTLPHVLAHIASASSTKIWFRHDRFADRVLELLSTLPFKLRCLDVYPYSGQLPIQLVFQHFPAVGAMTLRPHGSNFFWDGVPLPEFPPFTHLETLVLDSVNLGADAVLPPSITQLEWSNRNEERFREFLPKLRGLVRLEYLLLSHVNFETPGSFRDFVDALRTMAHMQFLVFRFVKFSASPLAWDFDFLLENPVPLSAIRVLKLDLCYGNVNIYLRHFLEITAPNVLKIVALHCIYEDLDLANIYKAVPLLADRQISLQFGLLQKGGKFVPPPPPKDGELVFPPICFRNILWKVDMSFVEDGELLNGLLSAGSNYWHISEMKFVQCPAVSDAFLASVAQKCPRLKKLSLSDCKNVSHVGINALIRDWSLRKSRHLHILWRHAEHPAAYYINHLLQEKSLLAGLRSRFIGKKLPGDVDAERIFIWDQDYDVHEGKSMVIQDYGDSESHWILGFSIPRDPEDVESEDAPTPTPQQEEEEEEEGD